MKKRKNHTRHTKPSEAKIASAKSVFRDKYNDGNIAFDQFFELTQQPCFYCGLKAKYSNVTNYFKRQLRRGYASEFSVKYGNYRYNGLDRVDNNLPHNINNVVPCCKPCNWAKSNMSLKDFKKWIKRLITHQNNK